MDNVSPVGRCLIVSETYLPLIGGAEMYTYNFAKQLVARGYVVTILTHAYGDIPAEYILPNAMIRSVAKVPKRKFWKLPSLLKEIGNGVKEHDLLFANYTYSLSTLLVVFAFFYRKPVTVFAHGLGTIIDRMHPRIYRIYRYITLRLATSIVTTSEEIAEIVRAFAKRVLVATAVDFSHVRSCAEQPYNPPNAVKGKKIILTIRRLVEKNGIQFLIEAIPYLLTLRDDFVCIIIGDGRLRKEIEARVHELGLEPYVIFLGEMKNADVFPYVIHADTVVFPSSAEALSLAAIECLYLETPVIASGIGGLLELIGTHEERGTLIDLFGRTTSLYTAPDPRSLSIEKYKIFAKSLNRVLSGGADIDAKARAAQMYVTERYDWPHVAEQILSFAAARFN